MSKFKKMTASVLAMASIASMSSVMANAEEINVVNVSYETLAANVITEDGTTIPAGSVAVEVSIDNNTGFQGSSLTFDLGNANALTDAEGAPILESGAVLNSALTSAAQKDNQLVVAYASADTMTADGTMFTFYLPATSEVTFSETVDVQPVNEISPLATYKKYWIIGDADGDLKIRVEDCIAVMEAVQKAGGIMVSVEAVDKDLEHFFPNSKMPTAACVDGNEDGDIMDTSVDESLSDAQQILNYYATTSAGNVYKVKDWRLGEKLYYYVVM